MNMISQAFTRTFTNTERRLIRWSVVLLFLGRAWQGLFWDLPLRTFFWDQYLLQGLVEWFTQDSWQQYVTNQSVDVDAWINRLTFVLGLFWLCCAVAAATVKTSGRFAQLVLKVGAFSLFVLAFLYFKEKFYALGQMFEYSSQIGAALILLYAVVHNSNNARFRFIIRIIIAITFVCHGLYAYGYYPRPDAWIQWCMDIFGFSTNKQAAYFLWLIGCLDFVAAAALFFKPTFRIALLYCIVWGFATALARVVGNFYWDNALLSLHQHAYESVYRLVHGSLPLFLWFCAQASHNTGR